MADQPKSSLIKDAQYTLQLLGVILMNLAIFWVFYNKGSLLEGNWNELAKSWQKALLPGAASLLVVGLTRFFSDTVKARLVFLRWNNPLPGTRVFSEYIDADPRIDKKRLEAKIGTFPSEPNDQNATWYRLYRSIESQPDAKHVHRDYLFTRDCACIIVLLFIALLPFALASFSSVSAALAFGGILAAEYFFVRIAAVNSAKRLVTTVLAIIAGTPQV